MEMGTCLFLDDRRFAENGSSCHPSQLSLFFFFFRDTSHPVTVNVLDLLRLSVHAKARRALASDCAELLRRRAPFGGDVISPSLSHHRLLSAPNKRRPQCSLDHHHPFYTSCSLCSFFYFHHPTLVFSVLQPSLLSILIKTKQKNVMTPDKKAGRPSPRTAYRHTGWCALVSFVMMKLYLRLIGRENKASVKMDQHVLTGEPDFTRRCLIS